jgi:MFS family permease
VGFLLRGTANSYGMFTFWTVIAGLGFGIIWAPIAVLAATWFPAREIGVANPLWAVGYGFGQAFGALTSLTFMQNYGWDTTWLIYGIIAAAPVGAAVGSLVVPPFAFGGGRARNTALASAIVAPTCLVALFYAPVGGAGVALLMTINFVFGLTGVAVVTLSMGMG